MRIEVELFLKGHIIDQLRFTTKESITLMFKYGIPYERIKAYSGPEIEEFLDGDHISLEYISKYTLEHICKYFNNNHPVILIWKGIRPTNILYNLCNKKTIKIIRDRWPDIIINMDTYNKTIVKVCHSIIPQDKIHNSDIEVQNIYYMNKRRIDELPSVHCLCMYEGRLFHKIWREQESKRQRMLDIIYKDITSTTTLHSSIIEKLATEYNMDSYILERHIHDSIHLLRDLDIKSMYYNPNVYIAFERLGKYPKFKIRELDIPMACSLNHIVYYSSYYINDMENLMLLLNTYHKNIRMHNDIQLTKEQYGTFHRIHHKYYNASKILIECINSLKVYATYYIEGSSTLYGLKKIELNVLNINRYAFNDIIIQ